MRLMIQQNQELSNGIISKSLLEILLIRNWKENVESVRMRSREQGKNADIIITMNAFMVYLRKLKPKGDVCFVFLFKSYHTI